MAEAATYQSGLDGITREIKAQLAEIERIERALDPATRAMIREAAMNKEAARSATQCAAAVKQAKIAGLG